MEGLLQETPSTGVLSDNILVTGPGSEEHLHYIDRVLEVFPMLTCGLKLKSAKFMKSVLECQYALTRKGSTQLMQRWRPTRGPKFQITPLSLIRSWGCQLLWQVYAQPTFNRGATARATEGIYHELASIIRCLSAYVPPKKGCWYLAMFPPMI